jgi:lipopolysaccharide cholinephosphotransferase
MNNLTNIINFILIVLIFVLLYFNTQNHETFNNEEYNKFPQMTQKQSDELMELLKITHNLFIDNQIKYIMCGGTMLGSIRHKNRIPWDDDADLIILNHDEEKFKSLNWKENKCQIHKHWFGYKISFVNSERAIENKKKVEWGYPFVDIFVMKNDNGKYVFTEEENKKFWPKEYLYEDEMFPLKTYQFGDLMLYGPNKPYNYLNRTIGIGWETNVKMRYSHIAGGALKTLSFTIADYCKKNNKKIVDYLWIFGKSNNYSEDYIINKFNKDYVVCFVNEKTIPTIIPKLNIKKINLKDKKYRYNLNKQIYQKHGGKYIDLYA